MKTNSFMKIIGFILGFSTLILVCIGAFFFVYILISGFNLQRTCETIQIGKQIPSFEEKIFKLSVTKIDQTNQKQAWLIIMAEPPLLDQCIVEYDSLTKKVISTKLVTD